MSCEFYGHIVFLLCNATAGASPRPTMCELFGVLQTYRFNNVLRNGQSRTVSPYKHVNLNLFQIRNNKQSSNPRGERDNKSGAHATR